MREEVTMVLGSDLFEKRLKMNIIYNCYKNSADIMNLDPDIITEAWRSLRIRTPFDDECTDVNPKSVKELFSTLKELNQLTKLDDPNSVLECSNFSDMNKQHMLRLWQAKADENLKWGIDVVVANSNIRKSLHPKIWLIVDGQEIEMSLENPQPLNIHQASCYGRINPDMEHTLIITASI
ncbi:hypothetical protein DINM_001881 [Dirofilaria immitis]|nr:hypothetical protein [Dirofilaria immitis]